MKLLHNIGYYDHSNYDTPEEVVACVEPLSFDGVYQNVYANKQLLVSKDITLFIMGSYVGKDNSFDSPLPRELYCTWDQIMELAEQGCKLAWHTWLHPDLTTVDDARLKQEVTPPFKMDCFAYPYGRFDERVIEAVKQAGFKQAYSVNDGDNTEYQRLRQYL